MHHLFWHLVANYHEASSPVQLTHIKINMCSGEAASWRDSDVEKSIQLLCHKEWKRENCERGFIQIPPESLNHLRGAL